jgi:hypothetical protein
LAGRLSLGWNTFVAEVDDSISSIRAVCPESGILRLA